MPVKKATFHLFPPVGADCFNQPRLFSIFGTHVSFAAARQIGLAKPSQAQYHQMPAGVRGPIIMEFNFTTCAAIAIFLVVYAFIISERIHRTVIALLGAVFMVVFGCVTQEAAFKEFIDFNTIALLTGMMIQVYVLSKTGLFNFLSIWAAKKTKGNPMALLVALSILVAVCSAFLDNVTTVLLTVPLTFTLAKDLKISPMPFVIAQVLASNIGGTATLIGDPPNIMIGSAVAEIDFMSFIYNLTVPCVISFIVTVAILLFIYRKQLVAADEDRRVVMDMDLKGLIVNPALMHKCLFTLGITILLFCSHSAFPDWKIEPGGIAMLGASILLLLVMANKEEKIVEALSSVEWATIFFFVGLFVLVGGLETQGVIKAMAQGVLDITHGDITAATYSILGLSAVMSAFVDNIPFVATMIPLLKDMGATAGWDFATMEPLWWALSLGACLGGNGTVIGASANVVALSLARKHGMHVSFMQYFVVGFPLMLLSIVISAVYLWVKFL